MQILQSSIRKIRTFANPANPKIHNIRLSANLANLKIRTAWIRKRIPLRILGFAEPWYLFN